MSDVQLALEETADRVTVALDALIPRPDGPEARLMSAMRYAALGGGTRLRPFFVVQCGRLFDVEERALLRAAVALECVHTYSLIHDDLPCMDDDDFRRGRPTVHRAYDESTAVLAGDGLLSLSFEIICHPDTHADPRVRSELARRLAIASGPRGMVGGQMIHTQSEREDLDISVVTRMQRMKTGALLSFAAEAGAVMARASDDCFQALAGFAHDLGLAYQIADDLLVREGDPDEMGKQTRAETPATNASFVAALGADAAREQARLLAAQAKKHLEFFGSRAALLRESVDFVLDRRS
ncbi:MAG: polyprenyl synthetase family protein [Caulobacterales bacterium]|nr:polyprenyl synthetase family protein [Caulobacterales bacterium]